MAPKLPRPQQETIKEILKGKLEDIQWLRLILPNTSVGHNSNKYPAGCPRHIDTLLMEVHTDALILIDNCGYMYSVTVELLDAKYNYTPED